MQKRHFVTLFFVFFFIIGCINKADIEEFNEKISQRPFIPAIEHAEIDYFRIVGIDSFKCNDLIRLHLIRISDELEFSGLASITDGLAVGMDVLASFFQYYQAITERKLVLFVHRSSFYRPVPVKVSPGEFVIPYTQFHGREVAVIYDSSDCKLEFRISIPSIGDTSDELEFLKGEVMGLTSSKEPIKIGEYTFRFMGGYPVWGPYSTGTSGWDYKNLIFSKQAEIKGKNIYFWGTEEKAHYYPYPDRVGKEF